MDQVQAQFLVVINPFSGRKQGLKRYRQNVQPLFDIAGITVVEELITGLAAPYILIIILTNAAVTTGQVVVVYIVVYVCVVLLHNNSA